MAGRQHPTLPFHPTVAETLIKPHFRRNHGLKVGSVEWKKALAWGRYGVRELQALNHVHKFRSMKKRYDFEVHDPAAAERHLVARVSDTIV